MPATYPNELFRAPLPVRWLPDETIYSLGTRYGIVSGIVDPRVISRILFGHRYGGFPHALPSGVGYLARLSPSSLGSVDDIIAKHSIAPQLVATRPGSVRNAAYRAMTGKRAGALKASLGLLASGFGGALPLKACTKCVEEDVHATGYSHWRVTQQLPGVWICSKHTTLLNVSATMRSGQARYAWTLPHCNDLIAPCAQDPTHDADRSERLTRLADVSRWLWIMGQRGGIDHARAAESIWSRLYEAEFVRRPHRLRMNAASKSFCEFFNAIRVLPELERVATTPSVAYSQLLTVLKAHPDGYHPIRLASVVAWLFPNIDTFTHTYSSCDRQSPQTAPANDGTHVKPRRGQHERFLELLMSGCSISAAARAVDVEVATGQTWAASAGHHIPHRASVIRDDLRDQLIGSLRRGIDKAAVAATLHISLSSVNRILRTEPGLRDAWNATRSGVTRHAMCEAWTQAMAETGNRAKLARSLQPAAYAWLYRNEREWLQSANRRHDHQRSNNASVDWRARDDQLNGEILQSAAAIQARTQQQLRLLDLLAELPSLKRNLSNLDRLPLTDRALTHVLKRRRRSSAPDLFEVLKCAD